jgi:hypothetical protein
MHPVNGNALGSGFSPGIIGGPTILTGWAEGWFPTLSCTGGLAGAFNRYDGPSLSGTYRVPLTHKKAARFLLGVSHAALPRNREDGAPPSIFGATSPLPSRCPGSFWGYTLSNSFIGVPAALTK